MRKDFRIPKAILRLRNLVDKQADVLFTLDASGKFTYANKCCCQVFGCTAAELKQMSIYDLLHIRSQKTFQHNLARHFAGEMILPYEISVVSRDGEVIPLEFNAAKTEYTDGYQEIIVTARDISEKIKVRNQLRYISEHDVLSGLYNRGFFEREIMRVDSEGIVPVGVIICDVNGLKLINDTLGHAQGDRLIQYLGLVLKAVSNPNCTAARIGGDEFALIMPGADEGLVESNKKTIRNMIAQINKNEEGLYLSVAVGSYIRYSGEQPMDIAIRNADNAMYRTKLFEQMSARHNILRTLESTLSVRDHMTEEHAERMKEMAIGFGRLIDVGADDLEVLALLAVTHDIGKIGVPDEVLFKRGPLDDYEWEVMRSHSEIGYRIALESKVLASVADYILHHHEHWDGNGYPLQLKGNDIPLVCRILAIVDAYDAMINDRPYRHALSPDQAVRELINDRGKRFQPLLVDKFIMYLELMQGLDISGGKIM
ncbi:sensor domain-containing diguanylate cyclase/phosphohydrolase [Syntrophomonas curvata]